MKPEKKITCSACGGQTKTLFEIGLGFILIGIVLAALGLFLPFLFILAIGALMIGLVSIIRHFVEVFSQKESLYCFNCRKGFEVDKK